MIAIRSFVPSLVTFPGVVLRQLVHSGFCRILGVKVLDVRYFRYDTPAGYVLHEMPKSLGAALVLALGPLVVHSLLCFLLCSLALVPFLRYDSAVGPLELTQMWMGLSIGMHAFPPVRDGNNLWGLTRNDVARHGALVRLSFPVLGFLRVAQRLTLMGFDVAYAAMMGILLPWMALGRIFPAS